MNIDVYTFCWNEMAIIPFCIDYWKRFARHVYVFDNGSTDGSAEYLKQYDWISVETFGKPNEKSNSQIQKLKNTKWKGSNADYVVVCDMDECIIGNDIKWELSRYKDSGITVIDFDWLWLVGDEMPSYEEGKLLHELSPMVHKGGGKTLIFDPQKIKEMNFTPGAHKCRPFGNVKRYKTDNLYCLHINNSLSLEYKLKRYELQNKRLSKEDLKKKWGIHYKYPSSKIREGYIEERKKCCNIEYFLDKLS